MKLLLLLLITNLALSSCPYGCRGHGKCGTDGVCTCDTDGVNPLYYGADCSMKACPFGESFVSYSSESVGDYVSGGNGGGNRRCLTSSTKVVVSSDGKESRFLSNSSISRNLAVSSSPAGADGYYTISGIEFGLLVHDRGELVCKNELGEYVDKIKIIGRISGVDGKSDEYLIKVGTMLKDDVSTIFDRYNCYVTFSYSDLSLINPVISEADKITWKGVKEIFGKVEIPVETASKHFACLKGNTLDVYDTIDPASRRGLDGENDIVFTFTTDSLPAGLMCYYLGEAAAVAGSVISKVTSLLLKDDGLISGKKMYEVYNFEPIPSDGIKYGLLNCFNRYSNELEGKAYLMGYDSVKKVAKVIYDFELENIDSSDLKCEMIEEYKEITSLLPMTVEKEDGTITNADISKVITITGDVVELGCYNPSSYIFTPYSYTYKDGTFTIKPDESGGGSNDGSDSSDNTVDGARRRRNLQETKPSPKDICFIAAGSDDAVNKKKIITDSASFVSKHLILNGKEGEYRYFDENSIVKLPGESVKDNIYKVENITFNIGKSGSLIECIDVNNNNNVAEIQILKKIELTDEDAIKLNKYYVRYNNNKILGGNFKCSLIHETNDLSLFELSKPNNCKVYSKQEGENPERNAECDLSLKSMSYFLSDKMDLTIDDADVKVACSRGDSIEIYNYEYKAPTDPPVDGSRRLAGDTIETTTAVNFIIKEDATIVPSNNDICHIISYTPKTGGARRLADPVTDDLTKLKDSDYGKSLSNYIYKPHDSISVDIGKMNHKVYEVNNLDIIPIGINSYVGEMRCRNMNNEGVGYIMGKTSNGGYMMLFDFINENTIPSINNYDCVLEKVYNDLSLYYSSVIQSQNLNGFGECYEGKCDLKWTGMGKLLSKVSLTKDDTGIKLLEKLRATSPTHKFACMNKAKKVSIYGYTGDGKTDDVDDLTFTIPTSSKSYPLVGHICNLLSDFNGEYKYDSDYILNPPNESKLPPTLISDDAVVDKIYKIRRFNPTPTSIGYSVCEGYDAAGKSMTIIAYNYGKIKSESRVDSYYIRYTKLDVNNIETPLTPPTPESYSCKSFIPYKDTSLLIKVAVPDSTVCQSASNCPLTITEGYNKILDNLEIKVDENGKEVSFVCYSNTNEVLTLFKYTYSNADLRFNIANSDDYPKPESECSLLLDLKGGKIETLKDSEITLLSSKTSLTSKFNGKTIWKVTNINYGVGINKCYNKYSNDYVGESIYYGKMKGEDYISLVSYTDAAGDDYDGSPNKDPKPEDYSCKSYKSYNDLSLLLPSDKQDPSTCTAKDSCYYKFTGIKPLLESYGYVFSNDLEFNVGCEMENKIVQLTFTTKKGDSTYTEEETPSPDGDGNIILYIKTNNILEDDDYLKLKRCNILLKSDGSVLSLKDSDLNKLPYISSTETADKSGIYYGYNLNFQQKSGIMRCYDIKGEYSGDLTIYLKDRELYQVKLFEKLNKVEDFYKYSCSELQLSEFNDLSLFNPIPASTTAITWKNMKDILEKLGFKTDNVQNGKFVCIKEEDKTVSYVGISSVKYKEGNNPDLEFTVDSAIVEGNTCYLLSQFDGAPIAGDNIKISDVGKKFGLTGEESQTLPPDPELKKNDDGSVINPIPSFLGKVYIVNNVEYNVGDKNVIITDCVDKTTSSHLGESYVLSKSTDGNDYYIYYSWIKESETPEPAKYECSVSGEYLDLSLIVEITIKDKCEITDGTPSCVITLTKFNEIFSSFNPADKTYQFICSNSRKELHLYNYTGAIESDKNVRFTIETSDKVPFYGDKCNLLADKNGKQVLLSKSEYGKKNGILSDNINGEKIETSEKKVESVNEESIPVEIPKSGGVLKCFDKESGEYVGTIEVIGRKSDGSAIVKYNIDNSKMDISEEELNIDLFETEVESISEDMSLKNPPSVPSTCSNDAYKCVLKWSGVGEILRNPMLMMILRELEMKEVDLVCPNAAKENILETIKFSYDDSEQSEDILLRPVAIPKDFEFKSGSNCYVLVDGEGNKVNKENSELYKKIVTVTDKGPILVSDIEIEPGKVSSVMNGNIILDPKAQTLWTNKHMLFIEVGDDANEREMSNKITIGSRLKIEETTVTILGISRNEKVEVQDSNPRLLFENERMLATYNGIGLLISNEADRTISTAIAQGKTITLKLIAAGAHQQIECSGVGTCDRENGVCNCYNGFSGSACERMSCPKNCNNHGRCINNKELTPDVVGYIGFGINDKMYGCLCDAGYRGVDCSLKECPSKEVDRDCSNNGICDYSGGICNCFDGFYGEACQFTTGSS